MIHRHHFVAPETLGFDSDGSVLVCDKGECTSYKTKPIDSLRTEKRIVVAAGCFTQGLMIAVPLLVSVPWYYYSLFIIWGYLDYSVLKSRFHKSISTQSPETPELMHSAEGALPETPQEAGATRLVVAQARGQDNFASNSKKRDG